MIIKVSFERRDNYFQSLKYAKHKTRRRPGKESGGRQILGWIKMEETCQKQRPHKEMIKDEIEGNYLIKKVIIKVFIFISNMRNFIQMMLLKIASF